MNFGEKLKKIRTERNLTQSALAELINAKNTAISNWEKNINKPDIETLASICNVLNVNSSYFIETKRDKLSFTIQEQDHIKKYRTLDEYGKEVVTSVLDIEYKRCETIASKPKTVKVLTAARSKDGQTPIEEIEMTQEEVDELFNAPETDDDF